MQHRMRVPMVMCGGIALAAALGMSATARAHCDTLDGPVVKDARKAINEGKVARVLKWVRPADEARVKDAFRVTLTARRAGGRARSTADWRFFETLVRVHRAGEGEPFTGLKPAGSALGPAVKGADRALDTGSVDALVKQMTAEVEKGIRERYARARRTRAASEASVPAGRKYVAAYIDYVKYVEGLHDAAATSAPAHDLHGGELAHRD